MNNTVSCIVPCYNSEPFIRETIDSVLGQTFEALEILVVDDGSTDNTLSILKSYLPRITILQHDSGKNCGKSASLNIGIKKATGRYIAFLDHDDIWLPHKIQTLTDRLEACQEIAMLHTNGLWIDHTGTRGKSIMPKGFIEDNSPISLLNDCYIKSSSAVFVRKDVFSKVGLFDEELTGCDDHDMWLKITEKYPIEYIKEPLYEYRCHSNQLSNDIRMWNGGFTVLNNACMRNGYSFNSKRKRLAVLHYRLGLNERKNKNYGAFIKQLALAAILDPIRACRYLLRKETAA